MEYNFIWSKIKLYPKFKLQQHFRPKIYIYIGHSLPNLESMAERPLYITMGFLLIALHFTAIARRNNCLTWGSLGEMFEFPWIERAKTKCKYNGFSCSLGKIIQLLLREIQKFNWPWSFGRILWSECLAMLEITCEVSLMLEIEKSGLYTGGSRFNSNKKNEEKSFESGEFWIKRTGQQNSRDWDIVLRTLRTKANFDVGMHVGRV